jgi:hypothetical protein
MHSEDDRREPDARLKIVHQRKQQPEGQVRDVRRDELRQDGDVESGRG